MTHLSPTYQHFVPQFLLRNFAHPYVDPNANSKGGRRAKREKGKPFPGDPVVRHVNLEVDPPELAESPIKRILGQWDMYRDVNEPSGRQQHIEEMFSKLESRASTVFRRITKAFESDQPAVCLTRDERNLLRKFLFLLIYRGSTFHRRFYHVDIHTYRDEDSPLLRDYMKERGFKQPFDMWLSNIKAIIDLKMDAEGEWRKVIPKLMYPDDAVWFITHEQTMYMAICTPSSKSTQEFIVTDNCYSVFEGPCSLARDMYTGTIRNTVHAPLHMFAPITPKLVLVLRSCIFQSPEEDADPVVKRWRDEIRKECIEDWFSPDAWSKSLLVDLPIHKAYNTYSTITNDRVWLKEGEDGKFKSKHKFIFPFFPINKHFIDTINGILLDNTWQSTTVIYSSQSAFFNTLETYLTDSSGKAKLITDEDHNPRLEMLQKLSALLKHMGSTKQPVWNVILVDRMADVDSLVKYHIALRRWVKDISETPLGDLNPFMLDYMKLGGGPHLLLEDIRQAGLMWTLRVKIDSWSVGIDECIRRRNRYLLAAAYFRCPPRRVWLYAKFVKYFHLAGPNGRGGDAKDDCKIMTAMAGGEDAIAKAHELFYEHKEAFNRLMFMTARNDGDLKQRESLDLWSPTSLALQDTRRRIVFETPGSICDCGLPAIQGLAMFTQMEMFDAGLVDVEWLKNLAFDVEDVFELQTRAVLRARLFEVFQEKLDKVDLEAFLEVLFKVSYPTPPVAHT